MTVLLNIQSSPNATSASRAVSAVFVEQLRQAHAQVDVRDLDLVSHPPRHVGPDHLGAYFAPPQYHTPGNAEALRASEAYIDQLFGSDVLVIGTPMHNLCVSSVLKSWIDNVCRIGRTFNTTRRAFLSGCCRPASGRSSSSAAAASTRPDR